ncbi:hypothetical protein [Bradyrhizobium sp. CCBAU 11361]|uniref:hypothetical protein n=1 Tax=Bradyrhizobium sp. CCBAU 11361 TaxID=1630812 RepID=UPI0023045F7D|nr:hypothetical protein [Bradyrhizobium sp. CCBAU 11361]
MGASASRCAWASPWFWNALSEAFIANTISHGRALAALIARGGITPLGTLR